ncbi:hypothetical protein [Methanoculleus sp.]|nr:hypothetical protein [Methanoculleus sp.]MCK9317979.1 hypothetical protein [Methanoculleus sp.]
MKVVIDPVVSLSTDEGVLSRILHRIQEERQFHGANVPEAQSPEAPPIS